MAAEDLDDEEFFADLQALGQAATEGDEDTAGTIVDKLRPQ